MTKISEPIIAVGTYGPLQVMQSAAGYYVGTAYMEEYGLVPGSRDSGYFATHEAAYDYLRFLVDPTPEEDAMSNAPGAARLVERDLNSEVIL